MTDADSTPDYTTLSPGTSEPAPRPRLPWLPQIVCWTIIVASIAVLLHARQAPAGPPAGAAAGSALPAVDPATSPSLQLEIQSRYLVGIMSFLPVPPPSKTQAIGAIERVGSGSALDRLRLIPVLGELGGATAALRRMSGLVAGSPAARRDIATLRTIYTAGPAAVASADRAELLRRHGWFGQLAMAYGQPRSSPARQAVEDAALRTVLAVALLVIVVATGGIAGLCLSIVGTVLLITGRLRPRYRRDFTPTTAYLEAFTIYLGSMVALSLLAHRLFATTPLWMTPVVFVFLPVALVYPHLRGLPWRDLRAALGAHRGNGWWREMGAGIVGYLAGLPLLAVGLVITFVLMRYTETMPTHPAENEALGSLAQKIMVILLASVWAPITEELMFRGALFSHLRQRWSVWVAAVVVALVFAIIHPQGLVAIPPLAALAITFALMREWRGSIIGPMTAHALNNTTIFAFLLVALS